MAKLDREKAYGFYIQFWHQSNQAQGQVFSSVNQGAQPNLLRDKDQVEVDLVITRGRQVWGVEVKAAVTVTPADGQGLRRLASQERTSSSTQPTARAPL